MKTQLNQLERMYDRLTPKERAIISLQRWKAGEGPDEALKRSTPQHDVRMVWKYLDAARDTGTIVGGQAAWLEAKLEAVQAKLGILAMIRLHVLFTDRLRFDVHFDFPELLTESQLRERLKQRRAEPWAFDEAVELLVDQELEDDDIDADRQRQGQRVRAAIESGELRAVAGTVFLGDLVDWTGDEVHVLADRAFRVAILPDDLAEYVVASEAARLRLVERIDAETGEQHQRIAQIQEALVRSVARGLGAAEMARRGLEEVVAWAAEDFDGEEPLSPGARADLDAIAEDIRRLARDVEVNGVELELPETSDTEIVAVLKRAIAN